MPDPDCADKGIPEHLHRCDRGASEIPDGTLAYRRFRASVTVDKDGNEDLFLGISFSSNQSSINRADLCEAPSDVLFNSMQGGQYEGYGVLSFPIDILKATASAPLEVENNSDRYVVSVEHSPDQCNYAHCNLVVRKNGEPVPKIKPTTVKSQLRNLMADSLSIQLSAVT